MMKKKYVLLFLFAACCGCFAPKNYTYEGIRNEYARTVCDLSPLEEGKDNETCDLNQAVSLKDAIKVAMANNPDTKMAIARMKKAEAALEQADAAFYPYLGFYTEYVKADAPSSYLFKKIDERTFSPYTDFNQPGQIENYESGVNARLNLFNGGRDMLNRQMAESGIEISKLDRKSVENALIAAATAAYYDALAAKDYIKIAEESVSTVKTQLDIMNIRFSEGGALKSDVLSLEVRLAQAKENVLRSRNGLRLALTALSNILGISPERELSLKEAESQALTVPEEFSDGLTYCFEHRPELKKMREQVKQARMGLDMAKSGYLPAVNLQARYYLDDSAMAYNTDRDNWMVAVMLNWDLFTGFATRAEGKKAAAGIEEILAADRQLLLGLKMDVKNAYLRLSEAKARLDVAKASVAMAEESLSLVRKQYDGGSVPITRYLEAELDRNGAKMRAAAAYYDREKALAEIGRAIGYWAGSGKPD